MNAKDFLEKLQKLDLPMNEFYILGEGALLLYGIKRETAKVVLCVSMKLLERLIIEGRIDIDSKNKKSYYKLVDYPDVNIVLNDKYNSKRVKIGDFYLEDIRQIYEYKKNKRQKKDKVDVESIKYFLNIHPRYPKF